jgi:hypothetical protein
MIWNIITIIVYASLLVFSTYILSLPQSCENENTLNIDIFDYVLGMCFIYTIQFIFLTFTILFKQYREYQPIENNVRFTINTPCYACFSVLLLMVSFIWFLTGTITIYDDNIDCIKEFNDIEPIILWITHFFSFLHLVLNIKKLKF